MRIDPHFRFEQPCGIKAPVVIRVRCTCRSVAFGAMKQPCEKLQLRAMRCFRGLFLRALCERAAALPREIRTMLRLADAGSHSQRRPRTDAGQCLLALQCGAQNV